MPVSPVDQLTLAANGTAFDKAIANLNLRQLAAILPSTVENPFGGEVSMMRTTGRGLWSTGKLDHPESAAVGGLIGVGVGVAPLPPAAPHATNRPAASAVTPRITFMSYRTPGGLPP